MSDKSKKPSFSLSDINMAFNNLPPELKNIAFEEQNLVIKNMNITKKNLTKSIYDSKKEELIKPLKTQLNLRFPESLNSPKEEIETIKKDIIFYKKAYEIEAANINKIIISTNKLNNQLFEPLKTIKETLNTFFEDYKNRINKLSIPFENKKEGIDSINADIINGTQINENINEINNEMDSFKQKSINFFKEYNLVNKEITNDINKFISFFEELRDSVILLRKEITDGFGIFENITPEFEDIEDDCRIKRAMGSILSPLSKITELISESEKKLENAKKNNDKMQNSGLANRMLDICEDLNQKAKSITDKINKARQKINLSEIKSKDFIIKPPKIDDIEKNINEIKLKIEKTNENNSKIRKEVIKKIKDDINISRLDILFIIDCTNSINTYLEEIKENFNRMITEIYKNCPTSTIYIGFIGYKDLCELKFGEKYIDIDLTINKDEIYNKIKELESGGGGDEAEDLAGAFDLAIKKGWEGFSRFAILATDAPCHGKEYHSEEVGDDYPDGDPLGRDIKNLTKQFAQKGISLFCGKFDISGNSTTEQMFEILKKNYDEGKGKNSKIEFTVQKCEDLCETIIQKACQIYKTRIFSPQN